MTNTDTATKLRELVEASLSVAMDDVETPASALDFPELLEATLSGGKPSNGDLRITFANGDQYDVVVSIQPVGLTGRIEETLDQRMARAVEDADDAFWAVIAERFPEATTGDTDPSATHQYETMRDAFVRHWLTGNFPGTPLFCHVHDRFEQSDENGGDVTDEHAPFGGTR